jgi:hypothetical protein
MMAYPVRGHPAYRTSTRFSRYYWQMGAWLDQGDTGTCVGNALAHRYADSPNPEPGITQDWARELYVAASGDATLQNGTSALAACRVLASRGEIASYHWVSSAAELRNALLVLGSVCVGTDWFTSMFHPVKRYSGWYMDIDESSGLEGGHEYVLNGINLRPAAGPAFYRLKNSWGRGWGYNGTARVECAALEALIFGRGGDAVLLSEVPA